MEGPGKYDEVCSQAYADTEADSIVLIVIGGKEGHGFSAQSIDPMFELKLPELLRKVASELDRKTGTS